MRLENVNVERHEVLLTPEDLKGSLPVPEPTREFINRARGEIHQIVSGQDPRLLMVVGPCSIHDPNAALDYAQRLRALAAQVSDRILLVMRAYFEKPRTTTGWKGLINDPYLDDSFCVGDGLHIARRLLLDISALDVPIATEALDPITPQYLQELISWSAIGARTTESQTHREMASGLSCAVGFKNGTDGSLDVALNAMQSAVSGHSFLGISPTGQVSVIRTKGNPHTQLVMRGGIHGPNYAADAIAAASAAMTELGRTPSIMVDCSHANSAKDYTRQPQVLAEVGSQISSGQQAITGVMVESNIHGGSQKLNGNLAYGVSVTDACVDWATTETMVAELYEALAVRF